jgi:hypothetical protein
VGERSEILAAGMDDYVRKPYRRAEIFECIARHLGVRYVGDGTAMPESELVPKLMAKDLTALQDELRKELRDAVIMLNPERISTAIERISQENRALGSTLARYADRYAYSEIFDAIMMGGEDKALPLQIQIKVSH